MANKSDNQEKTNERARKSGAKINNFVGWRITDKSGNEYFCDKYTDVGKILTAIEVEIGDS